MAKRIRELSLRSLRAVCALDPMTCHEAATNWSDEDENEERHRALDTLLDRYGSYEMLHATHRKVLKKLRKVDKACHAVHNTPQTKLEQDLELLRIILTNSDRVMVYKHNDREGKLYHVESIDTRSSHVYLLGINESFSLRGSKWQSGRYWFKL